MKTLLVALLLVATNSEVCFAEETVSPHGLTFTLDPARTAPGTFEAELGPTYTYGKVFEIPWIVKFTGDTENVLVHDTEFAVAGYRDAANLILRRPIYRNDLLVVALSPRVLFPTTGDTTPVPGLAALASLSRELNSVVVNGELNLTAGVTRKAAYVDYIRNLGATGVLNKLYLFAGLQAEFVNDTVLAAGAGAVYRPRPSLELEFACRQLNLTGERETVALAALIVNFGRVQ